MWRGINIMKSVLQDWVMELPLREQGTLLTAVRGCDLAPKIWFNPPAFGYSIDVVEEIISKMDVPRIIETPERQLISWIRYCFMNAADIREVDVPGAFFRSNPPDNFKQSSLGHYPLHWFTHVMHAIEVIAYRHPNHKISTEAYKIYSRMAHSLHLNEESKEQMIARLSEDRIAKREVVS